MPTFFVTPDTVTPPTIRITGSLLHHMRDSLRLHPGETITLNDGCACRYRAEIVSATKQVIECCILETQPVPPRTTPLIVLAQALLKSEKMDWVIQKATELGVDQIVPVHSRHSVVKPKSDRIAHQHARWERIAHEAAQQSERWTLPTIADPLEFKAACTRFSNASLKAMLAERSDGLSLGKAPLPLKPDEWLVLFVGPEGGWAEEEREMAQQQGLTPLTLGPRILRAETAAIAALSIVQSRLDERG